MSRRTGIRVALVGFLITLALVVLARLILSRWLSVGQILLLLPITWVIVGVFTWALTPEPDEPEGEAEDRDEATASQAQALAPARTDWQDAPRKPDSVELNKLRAVQGRAVESTPTGSPRHDSIRIEWGIGARSLVTDGARSQPPPLPTRPPTSSRQPLPTGGTSRTGRRWCGRGESIEVAGFRLRDPLVYLSDGSSDPEEASCISTRLKVGRPRDEPRGRLGYYPTYAGIAPHQRANYLTWLAGQRSSPLDDVGYAFLFFYGLERRVLIEQQDLSPAVNEVVRLLRLYTHSGSFDGYLSRFLAYCLARAGIENLKEKWFTAVFEDARLKRDEDFLSVALAWFHNRKVPLPASWAMRLCRQDPRCVRSVVLERMAEPFGALFERKYQTAFAEGLILKSAKRPRRLEYRAASPSLLNAWSGSGVPPLSIPDVLGIQSQFTPLVGIWNSCIEELKPASRALGKGLSIGTREAYEALPPELRADSDHPDQERWDGVVAAHTREDGYALIHVSKLAPLHELPNRAKLTMKQSQALAATAEQVGLVIEPDARLTRRPYGWDDVVALLRPEEGSSLPADSRYAAAALMLELGVYIAAADGSIDDAEVSQIAHFLESQFLLEPADARRLEALKRVLEERPPSIMGLGKRLQETLSGADRSALGRFLTGVAAANGIIDRKEVTAFRSAYRAMQIPVEELDNLLDEFRRASQEPVELVKGGSADEGEAIPPRGAVADSGGIAIDIGKLAAIMAETQAVTAILVHAMNTEETSAPTPDPPNPPATVLPDPSAQVYQRFQGLKDHYHSLLAELLTRPNWNSEELRQLIGRHPIARFGYFDAVNEWSIETCGEPLLEQDGEILLVQAELIQNP